jgi:hypothetical protein
LTLILISVNKVVLADLEIKATHAAPPISTKLNALVHFAFPHVLNMDERFVDLTIFGEAGRNNSTREHGGGLSERLLRGWVLPTATGHAMRGTEA